jgi:hypothetical protein
MADPAAHEQEGGEIGERQDDVSVFLQGAAALSDEAKTEALLQLGRDDALWEDGPELPRTTFRWLSEHGGTNCTNVAMLLRVLEWFDEEAVEWVAYLEAHGLDLTHPTLETTLVLRDLVPVAWPRVSGSSHSMNHLYDRLHLALARAEFRWGIVELRERSLDYVAWTYLVAEADGRSDAHLGTLLAVLKPHQLPALVRLLQVPKSLALLALLP